MKGQKEQIASQNGIWKYSARDDALTFALLNIEVNAASSGRKTSNDCVGKKKLYNGNW
ncbi:hypothetical protein D9M71_631860 [compost metagenome]